ncbi:hypothetical protein ACIPIC_22240 [Streptomyces collinus]|uniref:hypothetical protein n=1 Tax=Streptomyces collinus TaxID=42684 RepID=UPI0037F5BBFD
MTHQMEKPVDPEDLYRAYGEDVVAARPILTGDVFDGVQLIDTDGTKQHKTVMVLDHPCSLRTDGVNLMPRLTVAEVRQRQPGKWEGCYNRFFLPAPFPGAESPKQPSAAFFDACYHVSPEQLEAGIRQACLSDFGLNLLLQRRVHHFSRVVVPTFEFQNANGGVYDEADLVEEWCLDREEKGLKPFEAAAECVAWLREEEDGVRRQILLRDPQRRSNVRRQMRAYLRELRKGAG